MASRKKSRTTTVPRSRAGRRASPTRKSPRTESVATLRRRLERLQREVDDVRSRVLQLNGDKRPLTIYERLNAAGLIGCIKDGPPDLSTNPKYMEGFGET